MRVSSSPAPRFLQSPWAAVQLATVVLALASVAACTLPADLGIALATEDGPVETLQALLLFALAAGVWFFRRRGEGVLTTCSLTILLFAMGARELEWHKAWAGGNMLKLRFYLGPATPGAKLLAAIVVLLLAIAAIYLLQRHLRGMWVGLRERQPLAITAATFFVMLVLSRIVDKSYVGYAPIPSIVAAKLIIEEMLELALPLLVLLGAFQRSEAYAEMPAIRSTREVGARTRNQRPAGAPTHG
jgi:hypothetical protein